jgi:aarF domain-containing kinase
VAAGGSSGGDSVSSAAAAATLLQTTADPSSSSTASAHFGTRLAESALGAARGLIDGTGAAPPIALPAALPAPPPSLEAAAQQLAAQAQALQAALAEQQQRALAAAPSPEVVAAQLRQAAEAAAQAVPSSLPSLPTSLPTPSLPSLPTPSLPSLPSLTGLQQQLQQPRDGAAAHFGARAARQLAARVAEALPSLPSAPPLPSSLPSLPSSLQRQSEALLAPAQRLAADAAAAADRLLHQYSAGGSATTDAIIAGHLSALASNAAHARDALLALPSTGWHGHDFATLCATLLAAAAACALVRPPPAQNEGFSGPAYAPKPLLGNGSDAGAAAAAVALAREPRLSYDYDPELVRQYFERRPLQTARRAAEVATEASSLAMALLRDRATGQLAQNAALRARQAREAIERLGPAWIKVAQAFSTRVDLLPQEYYLEVQRLQDRVPAFPDDEAFAAMAAAWGGGVEDGSIVGGGGSDALLASSSLSAAAAAQELAFERRATPAQRRARATAAVDAVCARITPKPVAAASLGQVYRATLSPAYGGGEVAIKVQRPGVLEGVCLDLLLVRRAAGWITRYRDGEATLPAGLGFFAGGGGGAAAGNKSSAANAAPRGADGWGPSAPGGSGKRTDWAALVDEWAARFLREMDYTQEAGNARRAALQLAERGVTGVVIPEPLESLTTKGVLVLRWVEGRRLAPPPTPAAAAALALASSGNKAPAASATPPPSFAAAEARAVCATLLNVYLTQLLETGELHADPHVGNLLMLPDGRVAILDWGLTQPVTPRQRAALLSYVAHLTSQDWPNVARDLQTLGFIPEDAGDPAELGLVEPLGRVLSQLSGGGGAAKLNVDAVLAELEDLGRDYPFRVPPFFALVLRAFSLIEGVALAADPDYSIVQECLPYVSKRLLGGSGIAALGSADPADAAAARQAQREVEARASALEAAAGAAAASSGAARLSRAEALALAEAELREEDAVVRRALRNVLCGGKARVDADRLATLADAFAQFTTAGVERGLGGGGRQQQRGGAAQSGGGGGNNGNNGNSSDNTLPAALKDALVLAFSSRGTPLQDLLADELAAAADALSRGALGGAIEAALGSAPALAAASALQAVPLPLRRALLPAPTPLELLARLRPAVALGPEDREALRAAQGVLSLLQRAAAVAGGGFGGPPRLPTPAEAAGAFAATARAANELRPLAPGIAPGVSYVVERAARQLASRVSSRAAEAWGADQREVRERREEMAAVGFVAAATTTPTEQQQQQQQRMAVATAAGMGLVAAAPLLMLLAAPLAPLAAAGAVAAAASRAADDRRA